jgi:hypothetical protein
MMTRAHLEIAKLNLFGKTNVTKEYYLAVLYTRVFSSGLIYMRVPDASWRLAVLN